MTEFTKIKEISVPTHSIILTVGPSGSGKSYFCKNTLVPQLKEQLPEGNIQYISSDDLRREILGVEDMHKMASEMNHASEQAFDLLSAKLKAFTSYPVNAEVVVVDTTGLAKEFRNEMVAIAREKNYKVGVILFDYKDMDDFYKFIELEDITQKKTTSKQIKRLRLETLPELRRKDFAFVERIVNHETEYKVKIDNVELYRKTLLPGQAENYVITSDIHECIDVFKGLIKSFGFEIGEDDLIVGHDEKKIIIAGDYVDKGFKTKETIEFIYKNWKAGRIILVIGNHENYVYGRLKGTISYNKELEEGYFTSVPVLQEEEELKKKFFEMFEGALPFAKHKEFVITHVPCESRFIGKLDKESIKRQNRLMAPREKECANEEEFNLKMREFFSFIRKEARINYPYHLFGHFPHSGVFTLANKMCIDTGAVYQNKLTGVVFNSTGKPFIKSVKSSEGFEDTGGSGISDVLFIANEKKLDLNSIDPKDKGRILFAIENKVNFISGTVSPAGVAEQTYESLEEGLNYFKEKGIKKVILQPKYMGSRGNFYIHKELEKCYAISRNGYKIKSVELSEVFKEAQKFLKPGVEMIILDAELMPWSAIGKGLIDSDFFTIKAAVSSEIDFLKENNFESSLIDLYENEYFFSGFKEVVSTQSRKELIATFGSAKERTYRAVGEFMPTFESLADQENGINIYNEQLDIYAGEGSVHIKPFSILKEIYEDGREKTFFEDSNIEIFERISEDAYCVVDFEEETSTITDASRASGFVYNGVTGAQNFFDFLTKSKQMEGIIIKPEKVYNKGVAPCVKVRNEKYLTIILGPDYKKPSKFERLLKRKSIIKKMRISINEFELGKKMLEVPYAEIQKDNEKYLNLIYQMICEEKQEKLLDPRL